MSEIVEQLKNILEAALLAAGEPLTIAKMLALFPEDAEPAKEELMEALNDLQLACETRGIELKRIGSSWRYQTKVQFAPWLRRLSESRPPRYSRALLETLAIIVYRQPVTRGDIEEIRGVSVSTDILRTLLNREWVKQIGQRAVPGHPALYGTTKEFLGYFNLGSLSELPPLPEKRDTGDIVEQLNMQLPLVISSGYDNRVSTSDATTDIEKLVGTVSQADANKEGDSNEESTPSAESGRDEGTSPDNLEKLTIGAEPKEKESDLITSPQTQLDG